MCVCVFYVSPLSMPALHLTILLFPAAPLLLHLLLFLPLQVPEEEVETWVVQAISRGLIDARMDQASKTVTVAKAVQREFTVEQWPALQRKLKAWKDNVGGLLGTVESSKGL